MNTTYSIVIVTRNRPDALALSLPLHLAQTRPPEAIVVVDSSRDPRQNQALITKIQKITHIPVRYFISEQGSSLQRNLGLQHIDSDVVFFPDDDSLVPPDTLEKLMRIYDLDTQGIVGGVCSGEALTPPKGIFGTQDATPYKLRFADKVRAKIIAYQRRFENRFFKDPFHVVAQAFYQHLPPAPSWLIEENAVPVDWMTGFRMSFRTHVIRENPFNENLGQYALCEDVGACLATLKSYLLIGAQSALIYHHKVPSQRANGRALGAMHILNRAYVIACSGVFEHPDIGLKTRQHILRATRRFAAYKIAKYLLGIHSSFGRQRFLGAFAAARAVPRLYEAPPQERDVLYKELRQSIYSTEA